MERGTQTQFTIGGSFTLPCLLKTKYIYFYVFRNGTLSSKLGAPKLLKALEIVPDDTMDLTATIEAHMPGICYGQSE